MHIATNSLTTTIQAITKNYTDFDLTWPPCRQIAFPVPKSSYLIRLHAFTQTATESLTTPFQVIAERQGDYGLTGASCRQIVFHRSQVLFSDPIAQFC